MRFFSAITIAALAACSSSTKPTVPSGEGGAGATCANPVALVSSDYAACKSCTVSPAASPSTCKDNRPLNACCAWVEEPKQEAVRATNLHYFSSGDTTVNLGCLTTPGTLGQTKNVTLKGFVKLFSSGNDSSGVKIEIFKEGENGALGPAVG